MGGFSVTVLGCSGSYAGPGGACTGYLLRTPDGASIMLDAGPGTVGELQRHVSLEDLTAIVLTHEHPDHWLELPTVYSAVRHYLDRGPIPVYGTIGTLAMAMLLCEFLDEAFEWHVIADTDWATIADTSWRFSRTDHYVETMAARVECGGRRFAFTADTGPGWTLGAFGETLDLAISEATFLAEHEGEGILHLSARQAGSGARGLVERLVISHLAPGSDPDAAVREAATAFGAEVALATVGATFEI